jgi:hypothetical protein
MYSLNSIPKVELDRDMHGSYSINDIILELGHFLDEELVTKVEMEVMSQRLRDEWDLSSEFMLVEIRNKEIN